MAKQDVKNVTILLHGQLDEPVARHGLLSVSKARSTFNCSQHLQ